MYAKYTIVLKNLLEDPAAKAAIDKALSFYPLYKAPEGKQYDLIPDREALNKRLLNHYKYREIGFDTVGRFLDELQITMDEIMPRYNELLKTVVTMAELPSPFDNVDVVETFEEERTDSSTTDSGSKTTTTTTGTGETETASTAEDTTTTNNTAASDNKHVQSQTPQGQINIPAKNIDSVTYADQVDWGKDNSTTNGSSTSNGSTTASSSETTSGSSESDESSNVTNESAGTTKHTFTKKGNQGVNTYAHDMLEFRTQIIDVVDQIIHDDRIAELFMLVY